MMKRVLIIPMCFLAVIAAVTRGMAGQQVDLSTYSCSEFLNDVMHPKDGYKLLRSLMMISWATGYAAARQKENPRADAVAVQLIAGALADACRKTPDKSMIKAAVDEIEQYSGQ